MLDILADECVHIQLVFRLRRLGYVVETVREFCKSKYGDGIADSDVLSLARQHRLAVLTANEADFVLLHKQLPGHYGILIVEDEDNVPALARRIDALLKEHGDVRGQILWLNLAATSPPKAKRRKKRGG